MRVLQLPPPLLRSHPPHPPPQTLLLLLCVSCGAFKWVHLSTLVCMRRSSRSGPLIAPHLEALKPRAICPHPHMEGPRCTALCRHQTLTCMYSVYVCVGVCVWVEPLRDNICVGGWCVLRSMTDSHLWCLVTSHPSGSSAVDEYTSSAEPEGGAKIQHISLKSGPAVLSFVWLSGAQRGFIAANARLQESTTRTGSRSQDRQQVGTKRRNRTCALRCEGNWVPRVEKKKKKE